MECVHDHPYASREPVTLHTGDLEDPSSCFTFPSTGESSIKAQKLGLPKTPQWLPIFVRVEGRYYSSLISSPPASSTLPRPPLNCSLNMPGSFYPQAFTPLFLACCNPSAPLKPLLRRRLPSETTLPTFCKNCNPAILPVTLFLFLNHT